MIIDYILDLPDEIAREFAVGIGMETINPVTGGDINTTSQDVDDYLTGWLQGQINILVNTKIEGLFLGSAKQKAQAVLDTEIMLIKTKVASIMKEANQ